MPRLDPFTRQRLRKLIEEHRKKTGQLPTLADLRVAGIQPATVDHAVREGILVQFYVTLTSGTIVKGYKLASDDAS